MEIKVGKIYKMFGIDVGCVKFTKEGFATMQTFGMTSGAWPGGGDISKYDDITHQFTREWAGIIKKFRLPTLKKIRKNEEIRAALIKAAEDYSSFGISNSCAWLGTTNGSYGAWYINSDGDIYSNYDQYSLFVIAPIFKLDVSKIILDRNEIKKRDSKQESIFDKMISDIEQIEISSHIKDVECFRAGMNAVLNVIDKYKVESEE